MVYNNKQFKFNKINIRIKKIMMKIKSIINNINKVVVGVSQQSYNKLFIYLKFITNFTNFYLIFNFYHYKKKFDD